MRPDRLAMVKSAVWFEGRWLCGDCHSECVEIEKGTGPFSSTGFVVCKECHRGDITERAEVSEA